MAEKFPKVGIGVFVTKGGKVLLNKRKDDSHGDGTWSVSGGHLEFGEDLEHAARREVKEETGVNVKNLRFVGVTNDVYKKEKKHYITIFYIADFASGKIKNSDEFSKEWRWVSWDDLPKNLFLPIKNLFKQGFDPKKA